MDFPEIDQIVLGGSHSLIMGNRPQSITPEMVIKKVSTEKQATESFGLFDNSTPNYSTYYPEVTAEDLKPQDGDFVYPVFRLLSEVIVHKQHNPIDFGAKGILKKAMNMLIGQTINIDHETALGNAVGSVQDVSWQKAYTTENGVEVPAGINGTFKIDGKSNPRIARGIMMDPPSIHSNSVTVRFTWAPSHPSMERNEFYSKLGTYDDNGEMFRRVVTDVLSFHETSLVAHGADPFAQIINDEGEISNPKYAESVYSFSADGKELKQTKFFNINYKDIENFSLSAKNTTLEKSNNNQNHQLNQNNMKDKLLSLATVIGLSAGEELTEENFAEKLKEHFEAKTLEVTSLTEANTDLETSISELKTEVGNLTSKISELEPNATAGIAALESTQGEAIRLYKLSVGEDKADAAILKVIGECNYDTAKSFLTQYRDSAEESFTAKCNKCGSNEVTRMSSSLPDGHDDDSHNEEDNSHKEKTQQELRAELTANRSKGTFFEGK
jgi:hypothetical protein